jgi:hypothetical protein
MPFLIAGTWSTWCWRREDENVHLLGPLGIERSCRIDPGSNGHACGGRSRRRTHAEGALGAAPAALTLADAVPPPVGAILGEDVLDLDPEHGHCFPKCR